MTAFIYRLAISLYHTAIYLASWFTPKAKEWVNGRKGWQEKLKSWRESIPADAKVLWMHCASLGEFEQGRPILELIRKKHPDYHIVLSFYSPSGYEQQANYPHADFVTYLPADSPGNARQWVEELRPNLVIFVKYEFWAFHLKALFAAGIPVFLVAGSFRDKQLFFQWYGGYFLALLRGFQHLYVQNQSDQDLLHRFGITSVTVAGDPRVDRVLAIAQQEIDFPLVAAFKGQERLFVGGSTWPAGEEILLAQQAYWEKDWKLLLAPHDISEAHLKQIEVQLQVPFCRYSQLAATDHLAPFRVMILDTIGMLSRVYHYGDLAYIGGGFGKSIHNTLEPAAHGLPILFGPNHQKFQEALTLKNQGGAFEISNFADFEQQFNAFQNKEVFAQAQKAVRDYLEANQGAAGRIMGELPLGKVES
jgi:3-deoxy-D-manno-octulosonic-acid transferase